MQLNSFHVVIQRFGPLNIWFGDNDIDEFFMPPIQYVPPKDINAIGYPGLIFQVLQAIEITGDKHAMGTEFPAAIHFDTVDMGCDIIGKDQFGRVDSLSWYNVSTMATTTFCTVAGAHHRATAYSKLFINPQRATKPLITPHSYESVERMLMSPGEDFKGGFFGHFNQFR